MNKLAIAVIAVLLAGILFIPAVNGQGCGNRNTGGTAGGGTPTPPDSSSSETGPSPGDIIGEDQDPKRKKPSPPPRKGDPVIPYTGNEYKEIEDLQLWGSVGNLPMRWIRRANSRAVGGASLFGVAHYWRHNFQWELSTTAADEFGRARLTLIYPDGAKFIFTETATGTWTSNHTLSDRLAPTEDGFVLLRNDAYRYFFRALPSDTTTYYIMDRIQDDASNTYTLTYNTARRVTRVTEPAGRYFKVSYRTLSGDKLTVSTLTTLDAAPETNQWVEFTVTNTNAYRYVWALQADLSFGNIAEVEFYEAGTDARLSGVVICSDSAESGLLALDGDPETGFIATAASGGYVGYDLGEAKQIGRVRFLSVAGKESLHVPTKWGYQPLRIQGANEAPISTAAISKIETSDGRSVVYEYTPFEDPLLPYVFPVLSAVVYGDGTCAEYKYTQVFPGARPLISEWDDVRNPLRQPRYKTVYQDERTGGVLGAVTAQVNLETGGVIMGVGIAGALHKPKVTYANGGTEIQIYDMAPLTGAVMAQEIMANNNTNV